MQSLWVLRTQWIKKKTDSAQALHFTPHTKLKSKIDYFLKNGSLHTEISTLCTI